MTLKLSQGAEPSSGKISMQRLIQNGNAAASCMFLSLKTPCIGTKVPTNSPILTGKRELKSTSPSILNRPTIIPSLTPSNNGLN